MPDFILCEKCWHDTEIKAKKKGQKKLQQKSCSVVEATVWSHTSLCKESSFPVLSLLLFWKTTTCANIRKKALLREAQIAFKMSA